MGEDNHRKRPGPLRRIIDFYRHLPLALIVLPGRVKDRHFIGPGAAPGRHLRIGRPARINRGRRQEACADKEPADDKKTEKGAAPLLHNFTRNYILSKLVLSFSNNTQARPFPASWACRTGKFFDAAYYRDSGALSRRG
jgi:hypothetical protein